MARREPTSAGSLPQAQAFGRFLSAMHEEMEHAFTPAKSATRRSFSRWLERRVFITPKEGGRIVPFTLNAIQRKYRAKKIRIVRAGKPRRILVLKARRLGITTFEQAESYHTISSRPHTTVATMCDTGPKTEIVFNAVRQMYDLDPHKLYGKANEDGISLKENGSTFIIGTAAASSPVRGLTLQRFHGSEVAFWCGRGANQIANVKKLVAEITAATSHGEVVLESTPNGREYFHHLYTDAKKNLNDWTPIFFRWFDDPSYADAITDERRDEIEATLTEVEEHLIANHGLTPNQIAWRRRAVREYGALFVQEFPEDDDSCFLTAGDCYFNQPQILDMLHALPDYFDQPVDGVTFKHVPGGYYVEWEKPVKGMDYRMGVDTSEGLASSDPNGYGIIRQDTGEQVAELHGRWTPRELAALSIKGARRYENALMGVEMQNHGHAVLLQVHNLGYSGARRLYEFKPGRPGWSTDSHTRPVMISELAEAVHSGNMKVRSKQLLNECLTFVKQKDGGFAAGTGSHDDAVMKWSIAWQLRKVRRVSPVPIVIRPNKES